MTTPAPSPDGSNRILLAGLAILGIVLLIVGWYHWFGG
jgi:hypothetical protein